MLLPYDEALQHVLDVVRPIDRPALRTALADLHPWRVLAEPLLSTSPHPRFDNSAVDGYAFHPMDLCGVGEPKAVGFVVATGAGNSAALQPGTVARIFTGARLPEGASAVAMQEDVDVISGAVALRQPLAAGENVRVAGEEFRAGEMLARAGVPITPGVAGLLASQGVTRPLVTAMPAYTVIVTGDEIVAPEVQPAAGELRDSVGPMLQRASTPYARCDVRFCRDDPAELEKLLVLVAETSDAVFIAGEASVGDRDFTGRVVGKAGSVEFHGVSIRPGKPLLFGLVNRRPVLGLPGNPASAFVCFHLFGAPLLRRLGGVREPRHVWFDVPYGAHHDTEARDVFARVRLEGGAAAPVNEQASFGLMALAGAHALARLPGNTTIDQGDRVQVTILPSLGT